MTDLVIFQCFLPALLFCMKILSMDLPLKSFFIYHPSLPKHSFCSQAALPVLLGMLAVHRHLKNWAIIWFGLTFLLGASFLYIEISEFIDFVDKGASWQRSAFLSSFFTLVGTHGLHIFVGLLWMVVMMFRIVLRPLNEHSISRIFRMALFWHFLDFVWIFIFTVVYGIGFLK